MDTRDAARLIELRTSRLPHLGAAPTEPGHLGVGGSRSVFHVVARGVLRSWWLILPIWVLGTVSAAAFVHYKMKPTYKAESLLRVDQLSSDPFRGHVASSPSQNESALETQVQLITSTNVLLAAAADSKISSFPIVRDSPDPVTSLRKSLDVKIVPKTSLIQVAMTSDSSVEAAGVVNTIVDAYLKADAEWSESLSRKQIERLTEFQGNLQSQLEAWKKEWLDLAAKGNVDPSGALPPVAVESQEPDGKGRQSALSHLTVTVEEYAQLRGQLIHTELELVEAESHVDARGQSTVAVDPASASATEFDPLRDPELRELAGQINQVHQRITSLSRLARNAVNDPAAVRYRATHRQLKERYDQLHSAKRDQSLEAGPGVGPGQAAKQSLEEAVTKVAALKSTRAKLQAMIDQLKIDNQQQGTDTVKVALVRSDLDQVQGMLAEVNKRLEALRFESRGQSRILRIDEARPTTVAASDKRPKLLMIIPFAVLAGLVGFTTALELYAGRVDCPDVLSKRARVEVFPVPPLPTPTGSSRRLGFRKALDQSEQLEVFANRIDHLRVALCGVHDTGRARCLMITSANVGEGKTTLSIQLAARCADAGLSTLLIDADLRRASLGRIFEIPDTAGLSEVLSGQIDAENAIVDLPLPGCRLLAAGSLVENPGRLIEGRRFCEVLDHLRGRYDMIIIDTPPLLPVPDALMMGRYVDGAVMATRHDASRTVALEKAQRMLATAHIPLLGIAINGTPLSGAQYKNYAYQYRSTSARGSDPGTG